MPYRENLTFAAFKHHYGDNYAGYLPVCFHLAESHEGEFLKVAVIDTICEWRLHDGKIKFLRVSFESRGELEEIRRWVREGADRLVSNIRENADKILGLEDLKFDT